MNNVRWEGLPWHRTVEEWYCDNHSNDHWTKHKVVNGGAWEKTEVAGKEIVAYVRPHRCQQEDNDCKYRDAQTWTYQIQDKHLRPFLEHAMMLFQENKSLKDQLESVKAQLKSILDGLTT